MWNGNDATASIAETLQLNHFWNLRRKADAEEKSGSVGKIAKHVSLDSERRGITSHGTASVAAASCCAVPFGRLWQMQKAFLVAFTSSDQEAVVCAKSPTPDNPRSHVAFLISENAEFPDLLGCREGPFLTVPDLRPSRQIIDRASLMLWIHAFATSLPYETWQ